MYDSSNRGNTTDKANTHRVAVEGQAVPVVELVHHDVEEQDRQWELDAHLNRAKEEDTHRTGENASQITLRRSNASPLIEAFNYLRHNQVPRLANVAAADNHGLRPTALKAAGRIAFRRGEISESSTGKCGCK